MVDQERVLKAFDKHEGNMKAKNLKWVFKNESRWGDKKIAKYIKYFCLPIDPEEVIALLDTTTFRTAKEGYLFTKSGIVVKEVINKLYYLDFSRIANAEIIEETNEYYQTTSTVWVNYLDGTKQQIFDYYINKNSFVAYINEVVCPQKTDSIVTSIDEWE